MKIKVNNHFKEYLLDWDSRFYFVVGGYGSSKSYNTALKLVLKALMEPNRKILVTRAIFRTLRESCYDVLKEVIYNIGKESKCKFSTSPLAITFSNGSRFLFLGLDDPMKLKSINGVSIIWCEEAPEVKYNSFKELNGRLRTLNQSMHIILSSNPVSKKSWTYKHFFENVGVDDHKLYKERIMRIGNTYYHHSTVDDNKFVPLEYIEELEQLKTHDEDLYRIARKGLFGTLGRKVLPQCVLMKYEEGMKRIKECRDGFHRVGMDFGFETSYNAVERVFVDHESKYLYIYWEYYKNKQTDDITAIDLKEFKESREKIKADHAEPKAIKYYKQQGFNMVACKKMKGNEKGSRIASTKKMKRFKKIFILDNCPETWKELSDLTYKEDKDGELIEDEFNIDPHTFSAIWYSLDDYEVSNLKGNKITVGRRI